MYVQAPFPTNMARRFPFKLVPSDFSSKAHATAQVSDACTSSTSVSRSGR
ncbi:BZ3500_MvSof-1268-A1-R1_Chr7-3g09694 [Microbotryum saponariae]|uniref:BZ3500_MvSof-1268-A1-R1_Chr7-3g09694 protein n=1 Tax=Microbotryum saponariae TaxID=289078 RepID=A0A2X0KY83_9BASI|nr:BZ3501_MvSof-1269-A2-R1_Chr7-2g09417 [Microbotryum saponariae]SDA02428.1 BZ3500_MvSof-1268-A1-R1_Chr7-3g09694 [Microbotryum saponariae]